jgi:hypothetical protein
MCFIQEIITRYVSRGRKVSTGVMRLRQHAMVPSPCKKAETNTNANNELALAA